MPRFLDPFRFALNAIAGWMNQRQRRVAQLTRRCVATGMFRKEKFCLVDVGAGGGIEERWNVFGDQLVAYGFDPLVQEVERLNNASIHPGVCYYAYSVGCRKYADLLPKERLPDNQPFPRTSAARALEIMGYDYVCTHYDQTGTGAYANEMVELDEFLTGRAKTVDFIKVDTDGHDYPVLLGAQQVLDEQGVLGLSVECQFHGPLHAHANLFANIDTLLRSHGFSLFDLECWRYTRGALPGRFVYTIPAQTKQGQVIWGEALYLRDAGASNYEEMWPVALSDTKLLKLACLLEMHGLGDCAVELLLKYRKRLGQLIDVDAALDLLTPRLKGRKVSYREYATIFAKDPTAFYARR